MNHCHLCRHCRFCLPHSVLGALRARLRHNILGRRWPRRIAVLTLLLLGLQVLFGHAMASPPALPVCTLRIHGQTFQVEVARTARERELGLMHRRAMPIRHGMLFVFATPAPETFWMKNTLIPLDLLYFDNQRRLIRIVRMQPCTVDPCPLYPSVSEVRYAVELNAGTAQAAGLAPGDLMAINGKI